MPSSSKDEWEKNTLGPSVSRFPQRQDRFVTDSGLEIDALYSPETLAEAGSDYQRDVGFPGEYPYTRGVQPNTYRGRIWTMRQYSGYATAADTNERYRYLLDQGQTGLSVAFDLPTQIGYDSDHVLAKGEVGKVGVPICSLADMEALLEGIPLDKVSTSMTINSTASILLCLYIAVAKRQGVSPDKLTGTIQNDILKEYIARGTYAYPPRPSMRLVVDVIKYCAENVPRWNTISVSGYHMREAGATAVQELAFTFADAIEYVQAVMDSGMAVDDFGPRLSFFFVAQNNLFEEVAKFRAARRMWARIMKERFGAKDPRSMMLRFHTQTAGVSLTAQQPDNNLIRCTVQALAAVLGGSQSLHVNSRDEALALPSEESVQLSLRTQQILAFESGAADVVDPLGGSYYVESLTNKLEEEALKYLKLIDDMGGAVTAIEQGFQVREIGEAAYQHRREVESGSRTIVGVNRFVTDSEPIQGLLRVDERAAEDQISRLVQVRKKRDPGAVQAALARLEEVARSDDNTVPVILECVEANGTLGEICQVFRGVFGEQQEMAGF
ncbi:MAG: methylmalonyl-CoA mutase family protein [Chloroflexi bacterium]|nr:methylmalonyl-CoA mutase family protein [Chloroflexota bacterium]